MSAFPYTAPLLPQIMDLHARWRASEPALVCGDEGLSWAEMMERVRRLSSGFLSAGLGRGDIAAVVMSNGADMALSLFALMRSGAASAPLNLSVSDEALAGMIRASGARAVIASADQAGRLEALRPGLPDVENWWLSGEPRQGWAGLWDVAADLPDSEAARVQPNDLLNIIYSSGTTGDPKGIVHTQQGRLDWAYDLSLALDYKPGCRTLFNIGLYSNISWVGLLCTALNGGTLYIEPKFDAARTWALIEQHRITNVSMVPLQYRKLAELFNVWNPDASSLIAPMSCGSPLPADVKARLFEILPRGVIELYGLTEGVITTLQPSEAEGRLASVGKPVQGTDLLTLDDNDQVCPPGTAGEIVAAGRILMPGYLGRDDLSRDILFEHNGQSWLRTGDIGYLDEDGFLYIVDRKKDMILSGGQNIYPQDLEAVLLTHPAVEDAAVIGVKSRKWGETPLALVSVHSSTDAADLKDWANARLGRQQRLAEVKIVSDLPRNPNGKLLKKDLRQTYAEEEYD